MPLYSYKAINSQGEAEEGIKSAADQQALLAELQAQGFIPIRIENASERTFLGIKIAGSVIRLSQKEILLLTGELATLLDSGLPLDRSLSVLIQLTEDNDKLSKLVVQVLEKVKGGASLADSLGKSDRCVFSLLFKYDTCG